jgi:hypothetical protein
MSSEEENTFDISGGFQNQQVSRPQAKTIRKGKGRLRKGSSDIDLEDLDDGYDDNLVGDSEDEKYLHGLTDYQREQVTAERYGKREEKRSKIALHRKVEKEKNLAVEMENRNK